MKSFTVIVLAFLAGILGVNAFLASHLVNKNTQLQNVEKRARSGRFIKMSQDESKSDEEEEAFGDFSPSMKNPFTETVQAGKKFRQNVDSLYNSVVNYGRVPEDLYNDIYMNDRILYSQFDSPDQVPEVLVVGATGETGRLIVRKLLLRGFRVRVLVRNLYSDTLDLLGPAVSYTQGDLTNKKSLRDAVSGVDKVVIAAAPKTEEGSQEIDYYGTLNLLQVFQDMRVLDYGRSLSTKRMLFKFKSEVDRDLWSLNEEYRNERNVCWKASEFDRKAVFAGTITTQTYGDVSIESVQMKLNLEPFSGFLMKVKGDGNLFRIVLRTSSYYTDGVQYEAEFKTQADKWMSVRLPFSNFVPYCDGKRVADFDELDRSDIEQLAISHRRVPGEGANFYLKLAFMKVYKTQMEPEVVLLSDATIPSETSEATTERLKQQGKTAAYWKAMGENVCRNSGLTYTIIRIPGYNNAPGNYNPITVQQDQQGLEPVSRADVAEIVVQSLLDPRACNLAFYVTNSKFAPSAQTPDEEISDMLAQLQPNT